MTSSLYESYVIGHKPAIYPVLAGAKQLLSNQFPTEPNSIYVPDNWGGDEYDGKTLSEYSQLFWLADHFASRRNLPEFVHIAQYRKFVALKSGITRATNTPYVFTVSPINAPEYTLKSDAISEVIEGHRSELVGPVLKIRSVLDNFNTYHILEDVLNFCSSIATHELLEKSKVVEFLHFPYLIPAPSLGLHKTSFFLDDIRLMKSIWKQFQRQFKVNRTGYQRRVGGFLLERFHSFRIMTRKLSGETVLHFANQFVVTEDLNFVRPTT